MPNTISATTTKIATNPVLVDFFGAVLTTGGPGRQSGCTGGIAGVPLGSCVEGGGFQDAGAGGHCVDAGVALDGGPVKNPDAGGAGDAGAAGRAGRSADEPGGPLGRDVVDLPAVTRGSSVPQFMQVSPSPSSR
jgi:hypothetical protein